MGYVCGRRGCGGWTAAVADVDGCFLSGGLCLSAGELNVFVYEVESSLVIDVCCCSS